MLSALLQRGSGFHIAEKQRERCSKGVKYVNGKIYGVFCYICPWVREHAINMWMILIAR